MEQSSGDTRLSVREIIDLFGGPTKIAEGLGFRHVSRVVNWQRFGFPAQQWSAILDLALAEGLEGLDLDALRFARTDVAGMTSAA
jgi:hypothetical protein